MVDDKDDRAELAEYVYSMSLKAGLLPEEVRSYIANSAQHTDAAGTDSRQNLLNSIAADLAALAELREGYAALKAHDKAARAQHDEAKP